MSPTRTSGARLLVVLAAVAALALISLPATPVEAQIDLTGTWNFSFRAPLNLGFECPNAQVLQTGSDVDMDCGPLAGTFDKSTGALQGIGCAPAPVPCVVFGGFVSPDGNSVSGVWQFSGIAEEFPFSGTRKDSQLPTPSPVPPPVGGIAFETRGSALPLEARDGPALRTRVWALAALASIVALGGTAWYSRRQTS